jgi:hypothetical protein
VSYYSAFPPRTRLHLQSDALKARRVPEEGNFLLGMTVRMAELLVVPIGVSL